MPACTSGMSRHDFQNHAIMQDLHTIDMFISMNGDKLPEDKLSELKTAFLNCTDSQWNTIRFLELKEPNTMLLISFFVGYWGIERFMLGRKGSGILKMFVFQLSLIGEIACIFLFIAEQTALGILCLILFLAGVAWWITDLCLVRGMTKEYNYKLINKMLKV